MKFSVLRTCGFHQVSNQIIELSKLMRSIKPSMEEQAISGSFPLLITLAIIYAYLAHILHIRESGITHHNLSGQGYSFIKSHGEAQNQTPFASSTG